MKYTNTTAFLTVIFLLLLNFSMANAATSGTYNNSITWTLDDDGNLILTGFGEMKNDGYRPWSNEIKTVKISNGITSIGYRAFANCQSLTSVTISNSVTSIGKRAFSYCI